MSKLANGFRKPETAL